jgi:preprotein translocase subunit SecD
MNSAGVAVHCYKTQAAAEAAAKQLSVQRVLDVIGQTARLEEREVIAPTDDGSTQAGAILPSDPNYATLPFTDGVIAANDPYRQDPNFSEQPSQNGDLVTYQDTDKNGFFTPGTDPKYRLGPVEITGAAFTKSTAQYVSSGSQNNNANPGWRVVFQLNGEGSAQFAEITQRLLNKQLAIVLDGVVQSAPTVQSAITGGQGEITGSFTEQEAKDLAVVLNAGALPVNLTRQQVETVSPSLGEQSLHQGIVAGVVGLVLLMLYLFFYYRLLGIVTWFGMAIWAILAFGLLSLAGATIGYSLTLAGIAGVVVSLGITADSYIVFYERLKDEVRHGKTLRTSVQPAFNRAWKTIVAADIVTITAAVALYLLAVGSVRGFALTLGIATALDLFVVYFFKRPTIFLMARNNKVANLRGVGLRSGVAAEPVPVMGGER